MKKIITVLITIFLFVSMVLSISANKDIARINDAADILAVEDEEALNEYINELRYTYSVDFVVLTSYDFEGMETIDYADSFYYDRGYGEGETHDGIMLTVNMEKNTIYISGHGRCEALIDDTNYDILFNAYNDALTYDEGVATFLGECEIILEQLSTESEEAATSESVTALPFLIDNADLLTSEEEAELEVILNDMSKNLECDVIVLTEASINDDAEAYADDYFDYRGYGQGKDRDGILFLVSMEPRKWHISGSGICNSELISTEALEYISEDLDDDLKAERYFECFSTYAERCDKVISDARDGKAFKEPFALGMSVVISLAIGFIVAFIVTGGMKGKLKSVRSQTAAANYLKKDSLMITDAREMFLYRQVTCTQKSKDNNSSGSHTSSSGRSHSGVGGSF